MQRIFFMTGLAGILSLVSLANQSPANAQEQAAQEKAAQGDKPKTEAVEEQAGDDKKPADDKKPDDEKKKLETVTAEIKPMIVYESFEGIFESTRTHEIKSDFKSWTDLKIKSVVEEGSAVSSGQELLTFDTESIDKALAEAEFASRNAEFDLETAKLEMKQVNETFELDNAIAEKAWKNAREDFDYYHKVLLPQRLKDIDFTEKTASYAFEYSKDELDQLEKMYTEDELTEESEEIVLKRARRDVESSERSRDRTMLRVNRERETDVSREQFQQEESLKRDSLTYDRAMITLPIKKQKTEIALAQAEFALKNKQTQLEELRADRQKMVLTAQADGILYFGSCDRGKWVASQGSTSRRLEPDKKLTANTVVMSIVDVDQMMIRASLEESKLDSLNAKMRGKALIKAAGNTIVPAMIKSLSRIPLDDGKFDCQIIVEKLPVEAAVMPGMGCKLSFLVQENKQALIVPKASVFSDDDGVTHYVFVVQDDKPQRKEVLTGRTSGDNTEILEGLVEGDKIAKAKP